MHKNKTVKRGEAEGIKVVNNSRVTDRGWRRAHSEKGSKE